MIPKFTACLILIIMAATWSAISYKHGYMVAISDNFMYLGGVLGSIAFGGDGISSLAQKFNTRSSGK